MNSELFHVNRGEESTVLKNLEEPIILKSEVKSALRERGTRQQGLIRL